MDFTTMGYIVNIKNDKNETIRNTFDTEEEAIAFIKACVLSGITSKLQFIKLQYMENILEQIV